MTDSSDSRLARDLSVHAMRLNRQLRLRHADDRIPLAQLSILSTLLREGPMTTGELAGHERIKPPSISRSSHTLEQLGLIVRAPHATDGRQVLLDLSEAGRALAQEDAASRESVLAEQLGELDDEQRRTLGEAVQILAQIIEKVD